MYVEYTHLCHSLSCTFPFQTFHVHLSHLSQPRPEISTLVMSVLSCGCPVYNRVYNALEADRRVRISSLNNHLNPSSPPLHIPPVPTTSLRRKNKHIALPKPQRACLLKKPSRRTETNTHNPSYTVKSLPLLHPRSFPAI